MRAGLGVAPHRLSFALLVFPAIWDWYVNWREKRRGFYTALEIDMLRARDGAFIIRGRNGNARAENRFETKPYSAPYGKDAFRANLRA